MIKLELAPSRDYFLVEGKPFFYLADTVWAAFASVTIEEWARYLEVRRGQGFNALQISILPITHVMVIGEALAAREPWLAGSIVRAMREAQDLCQAFYFADAKHTMFADAVFFLEEQRAAYGLRTVVSLHGRAGAVIRRASHAARHLALERPDVVHHPPPRVDRTRAIGFHRAARWIWLDRARPYLIRRLSACDG